MSANQVLDALGEARHALYHAARSAAPAQGAAAAIDAATLVSVVEEITHITILTDQMWHSLRRRAGQAADNDHYPDTVRGVLAQFRDRARDTARLAGAAVTAAQQSGEAAQAIRDAARELKKCPECGELAMRAVPSDLTAQQRAQGLRPSYAHHDRSQLCPVVGDHGDEPAQPVPATLTL